MVMNLLFFWKRSQEVLKENRMLVWQNYDIKTLPHVKIHVTLTDDITDDTWHTNTVLYIFTCSASAYFLTVYKAYVYLSPLEYDFYFSPCCKRSFHTARKPPGLPFMHACHSVSLNQSVQGVSCTKLALLATNTPPLHSPTPFAHTRWVSVKSVCPPKACSLPVEWKWLEASGANYTLGACRLFLVC